MKPVVAIVSGGVAVIVLVVVFAQWQTRLRRDASLLPVTFAHRTHDTVNCLVCHHNFADRTGNGLCFDCHRNHPDVAAVREEQFHTLCRECHREQQQKGEDHGPLRECSACHAVDSDP